MVTLYTPCTGFPDLEAKIAWGIARVALECTDEVRIEPDGERYRIVVHGGQADYSGPLALAYRRIAERLFSSAHFFSGTVALQRKSVRTLMTSGTREGYRTSPGPQWPTTDQIPARFPTLYLESQPYGARSRADACGHVAAKARSVSLLLAMSVHIGKPLRWDHPGVDPGQVRICRQCALLSILGAHAGCLTASMGQNPSRPDAQLVVTLLPRAPLKEPLFREIVASHPLVSGRWLCPEVASFDAPLVLLARYPHLSALYGRLDERRPRRRSSLHVARIAAGRVARISGAALWPVYPLAHFVNASPFNAHVVNSLVPSRPGDAPKAVSLRFLNRALTASTLGQRRLCALSFSRSYPKETTVPGAAYPNLLYRQTVNYLMRKEVAMINPEIANNPAVKHLASTVRYFVMRKNFAYVDSIRNAKQRKELAEVLARMLREAQARAITDTGLDREGIRVPIPGEPDVSQVISLAQGQGLDDVRLALCLLGLSRGYYGRKPMNLNLKDAEDQK